jgi:hypothetical protein
MKSKPSEKKGRLIKDESWPTMPYYENGTKDGMPAGQDEFQSRRNESQTRTAKGRVKLSQYLTK